MPYTDHHQHATASPPKRHPKLLSIFLKFIIMSVIFSLFLIFLGLAAIILLHILIAGSFFHRRRRQPPPTTAYSLLDLHTHLPAFLCSGSVSTDCSICLEGFKDDEFCRKIPVCNHVFHANCVDSWLTKVPNCPVCRTPVRLEVDRPSDMFVSDDECKFLWAIGVGSFFGFIILYSFIDNEFDNLRLSSLVGAHLLVPKKLYWSLGSRVSRNNDG
ncbi:RING-H2 finger protein ATL56-like [Rutidosis leptorrhynchoides]|uniref:RING-H2 finger protein ATL56-like n=1 Tax=Rutidosis leptorrhynchoides TaxID=125765 RepID=UPI003A9A383C